MPGLPTDPWLRGQEKAAVLLPSDPSIALTVETPYLGQAATSGASCPGRDPEIIDPDRAFCQTTGAWFGNAPQDYSIAGRGRGRVSLVSLSAKGAREASSGSFRPRRGVVGERGRERPAVPPPRISQSRVGVAGNMATTGSDSGAPARSGMDGPLWFWQQRSCCQNQSRIPLFLALGVFGDEDALAPAASKRRSHQRLR